MANPEVDVTVTRSNLIQLAMAGAAFALLAAFFFEYVVGLAPCQMCYYQRYAHLAVIITGAVALIAGRGWAIALVVLAGLSSLGLAIYHTGIERKWWPGPASCSGASEDLSALSGSDLLSTEAAAPIIRCDEIPWELFGLSMANYNIALSIGLIGLALIAMLRPNGLALGSVR